MFMAVLLVITLWTRVWLHFLCLTTDSLQAHHSLFSSCPTSEHAAEKTQVSQVWVGITATPTPACGRGSLHPGPPTPQTTVKTRAIFPFYSSQSGLRAAVLSPESLTMWIMNLSDPLGECIVSLVSSSEPILDGTIPPFMEQPQNKSQSRNNSNAQSPDKQINKLLHNHPMELIGQWE